MAPVVTVWSTKGGVGVSTVAAMLALGQVERAEETLVVDLCGDLPALFGVPDPTGPGVVDWCALAEPTPEALRRIEIEVRSGLQLLPKGAGSLVGDPAMLLTALDSSARQVIVDCGLVDASNFCRDLIAAASCRLLVVRPCFLVLRSARDLAVAPTGVIVVREPRRALGLGDIEAIIPAPVLAQITVDETIARSIDAGLIAGRLPRRLVKVMGQVIADAA